MFHYPPVVPILDASFRSAARGVRAPLSEGCLVELAKGLLLPIAATEAAGLTLSAALHGLRIKSLGSLVW